MKYLFAFLLSQIMLAPDGAGGGGGIAFDDSKIKEFIEQLNKAAKADRPGLIELAAKEGNLPKGDLYKKLKAAGWDPRAKPDGKNGSADQQASKAETTEASMRHKTPHPHYRRAGLVLTNQFKPYPVTATQLEVLQKDSWVEIAKKAADEK